MNHMPQNGQQTLLNLRELSKAVKHGLVVPLGELPLSGSQFGQCICARVAMNMGGQGRAGSGVCWMLIQV